MEFLSIMKIWKCWYLFHSANVCSFLSGNTRLQHMQIVTLVDITRVVVVIFLDSNITADGDCSHEIKRCLLLAKKSYDKSRQQRHHFAAKGLYSQSYGFSSSHVQMWELDHKEGWVPKNWYFRIVVLEKTFESLLDCKEIKPVSPKRNQPWLFIGRTDAEAEALNTLAIWCEELTHLKRPWCWERLKAGGEGSDRGWDGWMASLT